MIGAVFSRAYLDAEPATPVEPHLLPWLRKDIQDTLEEDVPKAEKNLKRIRVELVTSQAKLAKQKPDTPDHAAILKEVGFLTSMCAANEARLAFYDGKVHLLRRRLAASKESV